jgi:hypothetical protein
MSLTQSELRHWLTYDPDTGEFRRRHKVRRWLAGMLAGTPQNNGYWSVHVGGRKHLAHRLAWLYVYGHWPPDQLDHINGDRRDNRIANLRLASHAQNCQNGRTRRKGMKGAKRFIAKGKVYWQARIQNEHLGCFKTEWEAHLAYCAAANERFGQFARTV